MIRSAKRAIRRALNAMGYEIARPAFGVHGDGFAAQAHILDAANVKVVLDVGANEGQTALRYVDLMPAAAVHAFEPYPGAFARMRTATQARPGIVPHQVAVGDRTGSRPLRVNVRSSTNSFFETADSAGDYVDARLMKTADRLMVPVTTVDRFCKENGIDHVDVLKLDIQGAELLALEGAGELLARATIDLVYSEVLFAPLYDGQAEFCDLHAALGGYGYALYGLFDLNYGSNGLLAWADAIWISPALVEGVARPGVAQTEPSRGVN